MGEAVSPGPAPTRGSSTWERRSRTPLLVAALLFAASLVAPLVTDDPLVGLLSAVVRALVWLAFLVDWVVRVARAERRLRYVLRHPLDLLVLLSPALRPVLLLVGMLAQARDLRRPEQVVGRTLAYLLPVAATLVLTMATGVLLAERDADGAQLTRFEDALWWSFATVTTVGYGDFVPVTGLGRALAVGGMLLGIGVIGTVTAAVAARVLWADTAVGPRPEAPVGDHLDPDLTPALEALRAEVAALRREVAALRQEVTAPRQEAAPVLPQPDRRPDGRPDRPEDRPERA